MVEYHPQSIEEDAAHVVILQQQQQQQQRVGHTHTHTDRHRGGGHAYQAAFQMT